MINFLVVDDFINNPHSYLSDVLRNEFIDVTIGEQTFKNIMPLPNDDEFCRNLLSMLETDKYEVAYNFIRKSPLNQEEPNFIHTDEMMGAVTAILYLSYEHPDDDGTTLYDDDLKKMARFYSKFNRAILFDSRINHSRNIFQNFGQDDTARLVQVAFLKTK
jgi:hypothetical protein